MIRLGLRQVAARQKRDRCKWLCTKTQTQFPVCPSPGGVRARQPLPPPPLPLRRGGEERMFSNFCAKPNDPYPSGLRPARAQGTAGAFLNSARPSRAPFPLLVFQWPRAALATGYLPTAPPAQRHRFHCSAGYADICLNLECGGKRSATPLSIYWSFRPDGINPKRRRRCALPAHSKLSHYQTYDELDPRNPSADELIAGVEAVADPGLCQDVARIGWAGFNLLS